MLRIKSAYPGGTLKPGGNQRVEPQTTCTSDEAINRTHSINLLRVFLNNSIEWFEKINGENTNPNIAMIFLPFFFFLFVE